MKKLIFNYLPLFIFVIICVFLWLGLSLNPREIPSSFVGKKLPEFNMPLLDKQGVFSDKDLSGNVSILNVFASWCSACKDEQVFLLKLANSGIKIFGINYKDNTHNAISWLETWGNPYIAIGTDVNGLVALDLGIYGTPETFLIDKNGVIKYRYAGILNQQVWREKFMPILREEENK